LYHSSVWFFVLLLPCFCVGNRWVSECSHFVALGRKLSSLLASSAQLNSAWRGPAGVFSLRLAVSRLFWITQLMDLSHQLGANTWRNIQVLDLLMETGGGGGIWELREFGKTTMVQKTIMLKSREEIIILEIQRVYSRGTKKEKSKPVVWSSFFGLQMRILNIKDMFRDRATGTHYCMSSQFSTSVVVGLKWILYELHCMS
jgi:hypothetical protein